VADPITGASFIVMHKHQTKPTFAREALNFSIGPITRRQDGEELDYVPMPDSVPFKKSGPSRAGSKSKGPTEVQVEPGGHLSEERLTLLPASPLVRGPMGKEGERTAEPV